MNRTINDLRTKTKIKNHKNENEEQDVFKAIAKDRLLRQQLGQHSHQMFFTIYFPHYITYPMAEFHKDIFRITEDQSNNLACIVAFRGSGKSTLITFSYSLWSILGVQKKKFVLIICQTQVQARQHMANLKHELENNALLKSDMGPFREENSVGDWAISSLVFSNTGARVMIGSYDQSIRGLRHREHRPDLIILDDIEDGNLVRTHESRNKIAEWFSREVVPLGDIGSRIILCGNLLHEDSLIMRLKQKIDNKKIRGICKWFPLLDENGICLWPGKFDTPQKIQELKQSVVSETAWCQEYLLRIVSDEGRVIFPEWIHYYDDIGEKPEDLRYILTGVDPAISIRESADCTAAVSAKVYGHNDKLRIFILQNPLNERLDFPHAVEKLKLLSKCLKTTMLVENVSFQRSLAQQLQRENIPAEEVTIPGQDKRARLSMISHLIKDGKILFPRHGAENLISQLIGFGMERHDDLADALTLLIFNIIEKDNEPIPEVWVINSYPRRRCRALDFWNDDDD